MPDEPAPRPSRRKVLLAGAAGLTAGGLGLLFYKLLARRRSYPPGLVRDGSGLVRVKPGFEVTVIDRAGDAMSDGFRVPALPDGMACFPGRAPTELVLMRNHELSRNQSAQSAYPNREAPSQAYDRESFGGVTRVVLDAASLTVERTELALTGTSRNCAGGATPWGWLTCEEDPDAPHGYVFLCDHLGAGLAAPRRLEALGRYRHEAAALELASNAVYLTEDQPDGCLYRFVSKTPLDGRSFEGRLEALAITGKRGFDTSSLRVGESLAVEWVELDDVTPSADDLRKRARERGAAIVKRGEGIFSTTAHDAKASPSIVFAATAGGARGRGQVFHLDPQSGSLEVAFEAAGDELLDMPDNVAIGPRGEIYIAEDGEPPNGVRVLTPEGRIETLAVAEEAGEIAGVTLSPAGDVLFFNLQQRGVTVALRGPFADLA
ncbi:MAG: DUF839 domain-containing protein [Polyangiaceae bacterium]